MIQNFLKYKSGWWFGRCFFPWIGNFIIPTDFIFFRGVGIPPNSKDPRNLSETVFSPGRCEDIASIRASKKRIEEGDLAYVTRDIGG